MLCTFTLAEVNYPHVSPQSQLAVFAMLGLVLCFLNKPLHRRFAKVKGLPNWPNHEHHYHVRIKPPKRIEGQVE